MKSSKGNIRRARPAPMRQKLCGALLLAMVACTAPAWAQRNDAPQAYSISAGDLASALDQLASQSKVQILYPAELVRGKRVAVVSGQQTWREALQKLLAGSGLEWGFVNDTTVVIRRSEKAETANAATPAADVHTKKNPQIETQDLKKITVTGTRIRGGTSPSPTIVMDEVQFQQEGFTDLGEVIRNIPQNYSGGQNPGVATGSSGGNINNTGSSALNLRGLGADATLTLLNGHRLSYDGYIQAVDISAIPIDAVERLEVVPDGASAIYGSDAVGGVANVVLKREFDGVTLGAEYGKATQGGLTTHAYTATVGQTWDTGGLIATFKKEDQDPIYARQRDYTQHMHDPTTLYPEYGLRSGLISAHQAFGEGIELQLDALKTVRDMMQINPTATTIFHYDIETSVVLLSPSLVVSMPHDWTLTANYTRGQDESHQISNSITSAGTTSSTFCMCNETNAWELGGEGPLFDVGKSTSRLAVGIGWRKNEFAYSSPATPIYGSEASRYFYGELAIPFVSQDDARPGLHRLELSMAARSEDYDSFGRVSTPKLGLIYDPTDDLTVKASWGRSFKTPTLMQRHLTRISLLYPAQTLGGAGYPAGSTVLMSSGGEPNLGAERARTAIVSLVFHPVAVPGLEVELSGFDIEYAGRVTTPLVGVSQALSDPAYATYVTYAPTAEQQQAFIAAYADGFFNLVGANYDPASVVAMVRNEYFNVGRWSARGADLTGSYRLDLAASKLTLRGSASWLDSSQQNTAGGAMIDLAGTVFHPARLNAHVGAVWSTGGLSVSGFANYTAGVTSALTSTTEKTGSFTTFDATVRYETAAGDSPLSGVVVSLSAQNLLDRDPSPHTPRLAYYVPYDSTNYSAIGRYVSLAISKHW